MRCSLGYALRSEDDVCKCLSVSGPSECWKSEPSWRVEPDQLPTEPEQVTILVATPAGEKTEQSPNGRTPTGQQQSGGRRRKASAQNRSTQ